eukprot:scaffold49312_cov17-Tisochrysis_lutea.AAC.2
MAGAACMAHTSSHACFNKACIKACSAAGRSCCFRRHCISVTYVSERTGFAYVSVSLATLPPLACKKGGEMHAWEEGTWSQSNESMGASAMQKDAKMETRQAQCFATISV